MIPNLSIVQPKAKHPKLFDFTLAKTGSSASTQGPYLPAPALQEANPKALKVCELFGKKQPNLAHRSQMTWQPAQQPFGPNYRIDLVARKIAAVIIERVMWGLQGTSRTIKNVVFNQRMGDAAAKRFSVKGN
ncbi:hypothetical protein I7I51_08175 [Histoplasma capsulatum]|uniref:Uncharacterized protein n=1 Tax=Ajellomyces capsulatus TaxID=5037 RepID=A0A8A1LX64_AJECA|nr:hypothetical protein I7I51_08175 [Histoplasma capsulatum]